VSTLESAVLSVWYCSRPEIRRLLAVRDSEGLRVLIEIEPALDSDEIHPAWMANRTAWTQELQWHTGANVRLEHAGEPLADEVESRGVIVADLSWRDPSSFFIS
jgi:hypothetical protein